MKNILLTSCALLFFCILANAQPPKSEKEDRLDIKMHEDSKADVYIDGKKYDTAILGLLDSDKIATIDVLKGEKAIAKYNAPNGVIIVTSQKNESTYIDLSNGNGKTKIKIKSDKDKDKEPLIIIDGKVSSKAKLKKLSPDSIESINVIKGEKALEKYDAPNGVIEVTTKDL